MDKNWYKFQEDIKEVFVNLGCETQTNVKVYGVRTSHDIDVLINSKYLGHNIKWIIEAKHWKSKVSKLHVLALRQIVEDIGVDKGFIVSEKGFQKGALEACIKSNIILLTFDELKSVSNSIFHKDILKTYSRRLNYIVNRYFSHSKKVRIKYGLKQDAIFFDGNFDVYIILFTVSRALIQAKKNQYPIDLDTHLNEKYGDLKADNFYQFINWLNHNLIVIEEEMLKAEIEMQKNNEFTPKLDFTEIEENWQMRALLESEINDKM